MVNKLLLVDGDNLIFYMGRGLLLNNDSEINEIYGFASALVKILKKIEPTHVLVVLNSDEEKIAPTTSVLKKLNIPYQKVKKEDISALISDYCKSYKEKCEIIISAFNYNYINLVCESIFLLAYRGESSTIYTPKKVESKWKIKPEFFADYKSLVGDENLSIAGIPRIGPKMAASLINEFGHVEEILQNIEQINKENIRLTLNIFKTDLLANINQMRLNTSKEKIIPLDNLTWKDNANNLKSNLKELNK